MHLFDEYLEDELKACISEEDYLSLGLAPSTFPKIYQELPKKDIFRSLSILKQHLIDKAILSLYANFSIPEKHSISLFTWVMPGGFGDAIAQKEIADIIKQKHLKLQLFLITLVHEREKKALSHDYPQEVNLIHHMDSLNIDSLSECSMDMMRKSSLIFQTPTFFTDTPKLLEKIKPPAYELLGEYGFIDSCAFHPLSGGRCMGLHFLEKGIIIKEPSLKKIEEFSNKKLLQLILKKPNRLYLGYFYSKPGALLFLYGILHMLKEDKTDIDFLISDIGLFFEELQKGFPIAKKLGIKNVEIYFDSSIYPISLQEHGKTLRLMHLGYLTQDDLKLLIKYANSPVCCRGDQSFSEVISSKKWLFYDGPDHAIPFIKDLIAIATHKAPKCTEYLSLFLSKEPLEENAFKMGKLLNDADVQTSLNKLIQILIEEYAINATIQQIVTRALLHYDFPEIAKFEKKMVDEFCLGTLPFRQLILSLQKRLSQI